MPTTVHIQLPAADAKRRGEATNFELFRLASPDFAGRQLVGVQWGGDPPDVLCLDANGKRIGVELVQWVNEGQMAKSKARFKVEDSYRLVIRSSDEPPPQNVGLVFIYAKTLLAPQDASRFRADLYKFVGRLDVDWSNNPEWDDPQGYCFTDFAGHPCLAQHLEGLDIYARGPRFNPALGTEWITFRAHGGAFTSDWMRDALLANIGKKITKYAKPDSKLKLQGQQLDEFYLLAYYDEGVLHNTPYGVPGFGFREISALVTRELASQAHPFDKVFLYSPLEKPSAVRVWPMRVTSLSR